MRAAGIEADDLVVVFRGEELPPGMRASELAVIKTASLFLIQKIWWEDAWAQAHEHSEAVRADRAVRVDRAAARMNTVPPILTAVTYDQTPRPPVTYDQTHRQPQPYAAAPANASSIHAHHHTDQGGGGSADGYACG